MADTFLTELRRLEKESNRPGLVRDVRSRQWAYYDFVLDHADRIVALVEAVDEMLEREPEADTEEIFTLVKSVRGARESLDEEQQ